MDLHDFLNVRRILKLLAAEWGGPVWAVKLRIRQAIDQSWAKAQSDPEWKAELDKYFPSGKPTPEQYILRLGHAHEAGEEVPPLLME